MTKHGLETLNFDLFISIKFNSELPVVICNEEQAKGGLRINLDLKSLIDRIKNGPLYQYKYKYQIHGRTDEKNLYGLHL